MEQVVLDNVWTTDRVDYLMEQIEDGAKPKVSPFWENQTEWRAADIVFEYTSEEQLEIERCATDVIYFANKYCYTMTDEGVQKIKLRDYQEDVLRDMQENRFVAFLASRQSGKTVVTGIFLTWYILFNFDKNLMVLANVGATTVEIIDKIKVIMSNLPFFLKPGIKVNNQLSMKFDNGCRLFGRNTTKKAAVGFTLHFLFIDEFAYVPDNYIDSLWRTVYPTLSSSKIARLAVVSTPNGLNKFYDIYQGAINKTNTFHPMRVDWWQIPGRDEEWVRQETENLGSVEDFNQEYGLQFLVSDKLLLDGKTLANIKNKCVEYEWRELIDLHDTGINYDKLTWHPKFDLDKVSDTDQFVFAIDYAGGGGGDYSVINIFKLIPMPLNAINKQVKYYDESDFFSLLQVGIFRNNKQDIDEFQIILETLMFRIFKADQVKVVMEMNFEGNRLWDRLEKHDEFWDDIFVHTKHRMDATRLQPGTKLNSKNKKQYCEDLKNAVKSGRIIPTEKNTFYELSVFGINNKGSYSSQSGHDDIPMSMVSLTVYFGTPQHVEQVELVYEEIDSKYKSAIEKKLDDPTQDGDSTDFNAFKDLMM